MGIILLSNPFDKVVLSKSILQLGKRKVGHLHFHQQRPTINTNLFCLTKTTDTITSTLHPYVLVRQFYGYKSTAYNLKRESQTILRIKRL